MNIVGLIRVDLVLLSPGGVAAPETGGVADLPLRRGRDGTYWVPPSSLAGSLRAHLGPRAEQFLGAEPPIGKGTEARLQPSPVRFVGTRTSLPPGCERETRASTAVDPERAAPVAATLRLRELLPAGTEITLYLRYDRRQHGGPVPEYDLDGFVELLRRWQPSIGRGRSTGHGRTRVRRVAVRSLDLSRAADLIAWLSAGPDELFPADDSGQRATGPSNYHDRPVLSADFVTVDALHIGSGSPDELLKSNGKQVIPSSTWKGLLRARCGYILRSCGQPACLVPARDGERGPVPACQECRLCRLFGWTGPSRGHGRPVGRAGELTFHDAELTGEQGERHHVGIDRFTGGARRQVLFTDPVITDARATLRITMTRAGDVLGPADRGLLLLAIRDLDHGLLGIGRSTTRGYGTVRLADTSRPLLDELQPGHETGSAVRALLEGAA